MEGRSGECVGGGGGGKPKILLNMTNYDRGVGAGEGVSSQKKQVSHMTEFMEDP